MQILLEAPDDGVQLTASMALDNLMVSAENQVLMVNMGAIEVLVRLMRSLDVSVQRQALRLIFKLALHGAHQAKIARSGVHEPLIDLARSQDVNVQQDATRLLAELTSSDADDRQQLVQSGAIPVLIALLASADTDVLSVCILTRRG